MTMSTIIVAVLVILVLVVMVLIFSKSAKNFFLGTSGCTDKGGLCKMKPCDSDETNVFSGNPECEAEYNSDDYICCVKKTRVLGGDDKSLFRN